MTAQTQGAPAQSAKASAKTYAPGTAASRSNRNTRNTGKGSARTRMPPRAWLNAPELAKIALTVEQAAYKLSISRSSCYRLMQRNQLHYILVGGTRRIPVIAVEEFVRQQLAKQIAT